LPALIIVDLDLVDFFVRLALDFFFVALAREAGFPLRVFATDSPP